MLSLCLSLALNYGWNTTAPESNQLNRHQLSLGGLDKQFARNKSSKALQLEDESDTTLPPKSNVIYLPSDDESDKSAGFEAPLDPDSVTVAAEDNEDDKASASGGINHMEGHSVGDEESLAGAKPYDNADESENSDDDNLADPNLDYEINDDKSETDVTNGESSESENGDEESHDKDDNNVLPHSSTPTPLFTISHAETTSTPFAEPKKAIEVEPPVLIDYNNNSNVTVASLLDKAEPTSSTATSDPNASIMPTITTVSDSPNARVNRVGSESGLIIGSGVTFSPNTPSPTSISSGETTLETTSETSAITAISDTTQNAIRGRAQGMSTPTPTMSEPRNPLITLLTQSAKAESTEATSGFTNGHYNAQGTLSTSTDPSNTQSSSTESIAVTASDEEDESAETTTDVTAATMIDETTTDFSNY